MDWLNLHIPTIVRSPEYVGSSPAERGTWLSVLAYAGQIECGGVLIGAADWKDRQWQQACGVTLDEVRAADRLLRVIGSDIQVNGYPVATEKQVRSNRKHAKAGGMARWRDAKKEPPGNATPMPPGIPPGTAELMPVGNAKGEGEGEGKGEGEARATPDQSDLTSPRPPTPAAVNPQDRWPYVQSQPWCATLRAANVKIRSDSWEPWEALCRRTGGGDPTAGAMRVAEAALTLPATARWCDRVEEALGELPPAVRELAPKREATAYETALAIAEGMGWEKAAALIGDPRITSAKRLDDFLDDGTDHWAKLLIERSRAAGAA